MSFQFIMQYYDTLSMTNNSNNDKTEPTIGKDVEQTEFSYTVLKNANGTTTLKNYWQCLPKLTICKT